MSLLVKEKCPKCGYDNISLLDYCPNCGFQLRGAGETNHPNEESRDVEVLENIINGETNLFSSTTTDADIFCPDKEDFISDEDEEISDADMIQSTGMPEAELAEENEEVNTEAAVEEPDVFAGFAEPSEPELDEVTVDSDVMVVSAITEDAEEDLVESHNENEELLVEADELDETFAQTEEQASIDSEDIFAEDDASEETEFIEPEQSTPEIMTEVEEVMEAEEPDVVENEEELLALPVEEDFSEETEEASISEETTDTLLEEISSKADLAQAISKALKELEVLEAMLQAEQLKLAQQREKEAAEALAKAEAEEEAQRIAEELRLAELEERLFARAAMADLEEVDESVEEDSTEEADDETNVEEPEADVVAATSEDIMTENPVSGDVPEEESKTKIEELVADYVEAGAEADLETEATDEGDSDVVEEDEVEAGEIDEEQEEVSSHAEQSAEEDSDDYPEFFGTDNNQNVAAMAVHKEKRFAVANNLLLNVMLMFIISAGILALQYFIWTQFTSGFIVLSQEHGFVDLSWMLNFSNFLLLAIFLVLIIPLVISLNSGIRDLIKLVKHQR